MSSPNCTLPSAIEEIDIGGVTLLRAAAKNHGRVSIVSSPADYDTVLAQLRENGKVGEDVRRGLALKAFEMTAEYDAAISDYFRKEYASLGGEVESSIGVQRMQLRYGANPHQAPAQAFVTEGQLPIKGERNLFRKYSERAGGILILFCFAHLLLRSSPLWISWLHQLP